MKEYTIMVVTNQTQHYDEMEIDSDPEDDLSEEQSIFTTKTISCEISDPDINSLHGRYKKSRLIIQPDFQRQFVWDRTKASRLIESVLINVPIPIIYLSRDKDGRTYVIDGQQRLTSLFSFIDGIFPDGKPFHLIGLNVCSEYNKKGFKDLPEEIQNKLYEYPVRTITFPPGSDPDLKYEIFERLNTGSVSLNAQELRNCMYRGRYNALIRQLSENSDFKSLLGITNPDKRMRDAEFVLRFAAFYHASYLNYKAPMKSFLNKEMDTYQDISNADSLKLENDFKKAVSTIRTIFGKYAFKRYYPGNEKNKDGRWEETKFNASLFDIFMYTCSKADKNKMIRNADAIREALIDLMTTDQDFIDAIEKATSSNKKVRIRFDKWRSTFESIIGIDEKETRCFSLALKEELFNRNPTCEICGQRIHSVDDAAVDHIQQYWLGGQTTPENARLTHRYCNIARSKYDGITKSSFPIEGIPSDNRYQDCKSATGIPQNSEPQTAGKMLVIRDKYGRIVNHGISDEELEAAIVMVLRQNGGKCAFKRVLEGVKTYVGHKMTAVDLERLPSGGVRWESRIGSKRTNLIQKNVLKKNSEHGYWELVA